MAKETKRGGKSETLTIRLDPKTRFMLEFMQRLRGQTLTTVVERAIAEAAGRASFPDTNPLSSVDDVIQWQSLWSVSEGERALKVATKEELFPTFEEERRLAFARKHWQFFYQDEYSGRFLTHYVDILWPRIDEFVQIFEDKKGSNYFAAGDAMCEALKQANVKPPLWPPFGELESGKPEAEIPF